MLYEHTSVALKARNAISAQVSSASPAEALYTVQIVSYYNTLVCKEVLGGL